MLGDIRSVRLLYLKGMLFVLLGSLAGALVWGESPTLRNACLLGVTVWAWCRAYYFAFYVIGQYVTPGKRYAGLWAFAREHLRRP